MKITIRPTVFNPSPQKVKITINHVNDASTLANQPKEIHSHRKVTALEWARKKLK